MKNNLRRLSSFMAQGRASSSRSLRRARPAACALALMALVVVVIAPACQTSSNSSSNNDDTAARGVIVVNAPATGEVKRVLVREGMTLDEGAPVVEIAVQTDAPSAPTVKTEDPQARAGRNIQEAQAGIETARAEVVRTEVEVQRLTPLVAAGEAPQGQLDGARADYERAQQRFQQAQSSAQNAQAGLVAARQQPRGSTPVAAAPVEQLVTARATAAGTVSAINARVGERVTAGQPLATLRADAR